VIASARFYLEPVDEGATGRRRRGPGSGPPRDNVMTGRVVVAGGTGRLGTLVVVGLAARGIEVRVLTRDPRRAAHLAAWPRRGGHL
jgi:Predicted nucleoside-diphosphate-sugar epimerases